MDAALGEDPNSECPERGRIEPRDRSFSAYFENPHLNTEYGIAWAW